MVRGRNLAKSIAVLIAVLFPTILTAQSDQQTSTGIRDRDRALAGARELQNEMQKSNFHNGPWYLSTRLQLSDIGFEDEFFVPTSDHGAGLAFSVGMPTRLYYVPHKKVVFSGSFLPGYSFFNPKSSKDRGQFDYMARGGVSFLFNHLFLDFYGQRSDQLRPRIGDVNALATIKSDEVGMSGELKWSSRTSLLFSNRFFDTSYPQDRYQPKLLPLVILDRDERISRLQIVHKTFPRTSLALAAEDGSFDFNYATYKTGRRHYIAPGFIYDAGRFSMKAEAGPSKLDFRDPLEHDFSGVIGQLTMGSRAGRWGVSAGVERDTEFAIFLDNNYYIQDRAAAIVEYGATRRLKLRTSSNLERDTYETRVNGILRQDDLSFTTAGFRYSWRRLNGGIDVGYYQRESNFDAAEEHGIRYILHLSFTP